jgi:hypothetical protein
MYQVTPPGLTFKEFNPTQERKEPTVIKLTGQELFLLLLLFEDFSVMVVFETGSCCVPWLVSISWAQMILLPQSPKLLGLPEHAMAPALLFNFCHLSKFM